MRVSRFRLPFLGSILCLGSCVTVGPDFKKPETALPANWSIKDDPSLSTTIAPDKDWWKSFNDSVLDRLVERAYRQNLPLQIAGLRIMEARAQLGVATGKQYPQIQAVSGSATATRVSKNSSFSNGLDAPTGNKTAVDFVDYQVGFDAIWELDFWGKYRRGVEAQTANLLASEADYRYALVSLTAEVARAYATTRTYEVLVAQAQDNESLQQKGLEIAQSRFRNGATSELDVAQATTLLESTRASIPQLQMSLQQVRNALGTLLGQPVGLIDDLVRGPAEIPRAPANVAIGLPAEMLRRRPDIRNAELSAAAQCARVGIAKADLYPAFSLFGTIGLQTASGTGASSDFKNSFFYAAGPRIRWPFFNYGRTKNSIRVEDARFQQALINYQNTVLKAAQEAEDALVGYVNSQKAVAFQERSTNAAQRSVEIALTQYREGAADYQRVLDAERSLLQQQSSLAQMRSSVTTSLIALYKALGGGWESRQDQAAVAAPVQTEMKDRTDWGDLLSKPSGSGLESSQPSPAKH